MRTMRAATLTALAAATALFAAALAAEEGHMHGDHQEAQEAVGAPHDMHSLKMAADQMVKGEIIDITCYLRHQARGEEHVGCAVMCANMGMPLGVVEDETGQIYLIIPPSHSDPKKGVLEHIGKHVQVQGTVLAQGGVTTLEIAGVEEI